jgi:predicted nucleic acid-binding protein
MILLDTNVISEAMKPAPYTAVRDWLDEQAAETLHLSSVTVAGLTFGPGALPEGRRKDRLTAALEGVLAMFGERILPFDTRAARRYGDLAVGARAAGGDFRRRPGIALRSPRRMISPWRRGTQLRSRPPGSR